jgi:hypothetical protein
VLRSTTQLALGIFLTAGAILPALGATHDPLRLPLTLLRNNPVTSIEVAGHEIKILVDTGGGVLTLSREALTQAGAVELAGEPAIWTDAYGQAHKARRFRVPQVRIGGRSFTNLEAIEAHEAIPNGPPVPNVLGREFLRQFIVLVDYPGRMMTLLSPQTADVEAEAMGCKGTRVPFERTSAPGLAITQVKLDGATMRLVWDTGATYSSLPAGVVTAYQLPTTAAVGQKPPFYNTKRLIIGGSDFGPLEFVVLPLELPSDFEGMLGYNVFARHVVCLNYGRSELRIRTQPQ